MDLSENFMSNKYLFHSTSSDDGIFKSLSYKNLLLNDRNCKISPYSHISVY